MSLLNKENEANAKIVVLLKRITKISNKQKPGDKKAEAQIAKLNETIRDLRCYKKE